MTHTISPLLNELDVAKRFDLSVHTLRKWRWAGRGPRFLKVGGRAVRYREEDLMAFLAANDNERPAS